MDKNGEKDGEVTRQPTILRYIKEDYSGILSHTFNRNVIGYVTKGMKRIHYGDIGYEVNKGDIFFLSPGHYHIEDIPREGRFEQMTFYYDFSDFNKILETLSMTYHMSIQDDHDCSQCNARPDVIYPAWTTVENFFETVNRYFQDGMFLYDQTAENMKSMELVYLILTNKDCCIKKRIIRSGNSPSANFEKIIRDNILKDITIKDLAAKCNRSLSSFKTDFVKHFNETPGKWFTKQKLSYSCLLLISTGRSVSEVATECKFSSVSHFTRAFKKEFGISPTEYRNKDRNKQEKNPGKIKTGTEFAPNKSLTQK